jgi:hypothetical protein
VNKCSGNRDIPKRDFPITTGVWAIGARVRDKCRTVKPCHELTPGGIENRRIEDSEGVCSMHFNSANSEILIGKRTVILWTSRSYAKRTYPEELRGVEVPSEIRNRGFSRQVFRDLISIDFPMEERDTWVKFHQVSGISKTRSREWRTRDHARPDFPIGQREIIKEHYVGVEDSR